MLVLYPNGETAAWWYDENWQPAKGDEHKLHVPIRDHPDVKEYVVPQWARSERHNPECYEDADADVKRGSWAVSNNDLCRIVSGSAYDGYMDNLFKFEFHVKDGRGFGEGISPFVLDDVRHHHFGYSEGGSTDSAKTEKARFYPVFMFP